MTAVARETHEALAGISAGRAEVLEEVLALREAQLESSGLDERTFSLVQIAVLIALDAPPGHPTRGRSQTRSRLASAPRMFSGCCAPSR